MQASLLGWRDRAIGVEESVDDYNNFFTPSTTIGPVRTPMRKRAFLIPLEVLGYRLLNLSP